MPPPPKFLLVDSDDDSRALLRWTLVRIYPGAAIRETLTLAGAIDALRQDLPDVALVHRAADADVVGCVRVIRGEALKLPILVLSGSDAQAEAIREAGATDRLRRDQWLRIRARLDQLLPPPAGADAGAP